MRIGRYEPRVYIPKINIAPRPDWLQHASLSFASGIGIGVITREPGVAAGGALTLGIGKELLDARRDRFDAGDLIADFIGASLAALVIAALER